jgi:hypothetical protein
MKAHFRMLLIKSPLARLACLCGREKIAKEGRIRKGLECLPIVK